MNTTEQGIYQSLDGDKPSPEQAAQLLELALQGDTGAAAPEKGNEPGVTTGTGEAQPTGDAGKTGTEGGNAGGGEGNDPDPANTVILAKDGKHTIGFEKLVEARQSAQHYKAQLEAAQGELARLQAEAQQRADAGQTATQVDNQVATAQAAIDAGVDPAIFGDFSEEALAKGIQTLVAAQVAAQVQQQVSQALAPLQQKQAQEAGNAHYEAIYAKHPDADSIAESKELADWIGSQPSFVQAGYQAVLEKGTTSEVIELFDRFKQATGIATAAGAAGPQVNADQVRAQAKAAVASASGAVPTSLSDFPGGRPAGVTREEAMADMTGPDLLENMAAMTPQQIETFLNRSL